MAEINAKNEFLDLTKNYKVIAAWISFDETYSHTTTELFNFKLKPLYTNEEYEIFLNFLDRVYDNGYGGQELFGVIYCEDGIWMDRREYDDSEWWSIYQYPDLRDAFDETDVLKYERFKKLKRIEDI